MESTQQSRKTALIVHFAPLYRPHKSVQSNKPLCSRSPFQEYYKIHSFFLVDVFKRLGYKIQHFPLFRLFLLSRNSTLSLIPSPPFNIYHAYRYSKTLSKSHYIIFEGLYGNSISINILNYKNNREKLLLKEP